MSYFATKSNTVPREDCRSARSSVEPEEKSGIVAKSVIIGRQGQRPDWGVVY